MKLLPHAISTILACAMAGGVARGEMADGGVVERLTGWFSPEFRRVQARLAAADRELESLPELAPQPFAWRYGFRSETMNDPDEEQWLQIDLGMNRMIDRVVAVPASIPALGKRGEGYGFPLRFRIEVADDKAMAGAVTVVDRTLDDVPNPGRYPLDFRIEPVTARYLRFTSTRHFPVEDGFIWALEELLVLAGNRSLAVWQPVEASSTFERFPNWSRLRVNDAQSALGLPVGTEPASGRGYLSGLAGDSFEEKWLRVDFGGDRVIDEVRVMAVEEEGFEVVGEGAFPRGWMLELANDPDFVRIVWSRGMPRTNLVGYPGHSAVMIPVPSVRARHLRLRTLELWGDDNRHGFGLAEIQAYSGDENVALGRQVFVSDMAEAGPEWSPAFVTNGYSSQYRLLELPEYLDRIARRGQLEKERDSLLEKRAGRLRAAGLILGYGGGSLGGLTLAGLGLLLVRQRAMRRRAVSRLREQIARDLHDDIGSNLGGIVLLSQIGLRNSGDGQTREDFRTIMEAAEGTARSMEDIVWLIEQGRTGVRDLIVRMRRSAGLILADKAQVSVTPEDFHNRTVSLFFRRHFFFAYKETLNNVRRHARASVVDVRIVISGRELGFEVVDDGVGFDPERVSGGHGLANLRRRAEQLRGECRIESSPGKGTRVMFKADMKSDPT